MNESGNPSLCASPPSHFSTKAHGIVFTETSKKFNFHKKDSLKSQKDFLTSNQESGKDNFEHAISKLPKKFSWSQSVMF
jgi:hypothetical protein